MEQKIFSRIFVYCSILFALICGRDSRRIQQFCLYSVSEQTENYTENVPDLELISGIVRDNKLQSVCSQMGVWAFFTGKNYTTIHSYGYHPATPGWTCAKRRIMADWQSPFRSLRHLGNRDLDTPSLSLYKDPFFASTELYVNGHDLSFANAQFDFRSFGFTGRESWTLYAEPNFKGESVCLQCKCDQTGRSIGVTYTAKLTISASSIRRGCFGNQVLQPSGVLEKRVPSASELDSSSNKNSPSLTLSLSSSNSSLTFSGTELRLPCMMTFDTFQISGKSNWIIFSEPNFDGPSACLSYTPNVAGGRGSFSVRKDEGSESTKFNMMTVASIRFGCPQNLDQFKNRPFYSAAGKADFQHPTTTLPPKITTMPSREGRGRNLGPPYIPSDIEGSATKKPTSTILLNTTTPPVIIRLIPYSPPIAKTTLPPFLTNSPELPTLSPTSHSDLTSQPTLIISNATTTLPPSTTLRTFTYPPPRLTTPPSVESLTSTASVHENLLEPDSTSSDPKSTTQPTHESQEVTEKPIEKVSANEVSSEPKPATQPTNYENNYDEGSQEFTEEPVKKVNSKTNEVDAPIRHATGHEAATISEASGGPAGMFFTAFLIILGILVAAMIVTIGVFIYLRATRSSEIDIE